MGSTRKIFIKAIKNGVLTVSLQLINIKRTIILIILLLIHSVLLSFTILNCWTVKPIINGGTPIIIVLESLEQGEDDKWDIKNLIL